ncbi:glycosyltransferase family 2 protein [Lactobacillus sp. CBA3605]|uniref:glycosyltransferase family 2 protein n=1 Tax=Lactobacillus sp. CBA3605 TaxID=2099788 RepID=UPI000CFDFC9B|nr:glycosyltransferase family A protein [Lactobacillus sp. CBA3605]AVK61030.1 glycosyltransferase family 2 protein [Lactobacillus sp. CBA3605]
MSAPLFSVVVPAYNQHKFINSCLTSLQHQTMMDFEVIVVNDCSTDDTAQQIQALIETDDRFKVVTHAQNRGVSAARNSGMAVAQGQYLCFVDGDDWVEPNFLATFLAAYQAAPQSQLVVCGHFGYLAVPSPAKTYAKKELVANINFGTVGGFSWNKCFLRSIITTHHLKFNEEINFLEDQLFAFRYADYVQSAEYLPAKTYHYRWRFRSNLAHLGLPFFAARRKMIKILKQESKQALSEDWNNQ